MQSLVTMLDWIRYATSQLATAQQQQALVFGHGTTNAFDEARALVLGMLNVPFGLPEGYLQAKLTAAEIAQLQTALKKRIEQRMPVPYISNRCIYAGLEFYIDERVLVPRSPMMEIIEHGFKPYCQSHPETLLDLCCGSGCLGIVSAYHFPETAVTVSDISAEALAVASINIKRHELSSQVTALSSDLFENLTGQRFDIIVSNPPYVDSETMAYLPEEFRYEPALALSAGKDGLAITRHILRDASDYLCEDGLLIVEVGTSRDLLEAAYPEVSFNWYSLECGGEGVFVMTYDELLAYQHYFSDNEEGS